MSDTDTTQPANPTYLSPLAVATWAGLGETTIYEWVRSGRLPHERIDGRIRIDPADVWDALTVEQRQKAQRLSDVAQRRLGAGDPSPIVPASHEARPAA